MKIRAAVLDAPKQPFVVEELELDPPRAGEVLVRLVACGVCHSDWHLVSGDTKHPMPVVAGHEGAGVVEAIGPDVNDLEIGDPVVLSWAPACGHCFYCDRNQPNLCDTYTAPIWAGTMLDGTTRLWRHNRARPNPRDARPDARAPAPLAASQIDDRSIHQPAHSTLPPTATAHHPHQPVFTYCGTASFATHTVVPRQSCIAVRRDAPLDRACLIGCAVATGVGAAMFTAGVKNGESVVVFGCGGVGLNIIQGAKLCGAGTIIAVDSQRQKEPLARQFGATAFVHAGGGAIGERMIDAIRDLTAGRGADHAFEAVGIPSLQERALDAIRPGGVLTLAGLSPMGSTTNFPAAVLARQEKTVKGSYYGSVHPPRDFPMLIDLYMAGKLKLDELVSRRYSLDQINDAFAAMLSGGAARGLIVF